MKKSLLLLFLSFTFSTFFWACKKDTSPKMPDRFELQLINNANKKLDVYISANSDEEGFVSEGELAANGTKTIEDLVINIEYIVRLMESEKAPDEKDYIYEEIIFTNEKSSNTVVTKEID